MTDNQSLKKLASRAVANLVAVAAVSAIFGLKAYIDYGGRSASAPPDETRMATSEPVLQGRSVP